MAMKQPPGAANTIMVAGLIRDWGRGFRAWQYGLGPGGSPATSEQRQVPEVLLDGGLRGPVLARA